MGLCSLFPSSRQPVGQRKFYITCAPIRTFLGIVLVLCRIGRHVHCRSRKTKDSRPARRPYLPLHKLNLCLANNNITRLLVEGSGMILRGPRPNWWKMVLLCIVQQKSLGHQRRHLWTLKWCIGIQWYSSVGMYMRTICSKIVAANRLHDLPPKMN